MHNVELKALYPDLEKGERIASELGALLLAREKQVDTYYKVNSGRLKLRESTPGTNYLVGYHRPDEAAARASEYTLFVIEDPGKLHEILAATLGVWVRVEKLRTIYILDNVRIHLDRVERLGSFIEFEAVIQEGRSLADGHRQVNALMESFGIAGDDLVSVSYSDLLFTALRGTQGQEHLHKEELKNA